MVNEKPRVKPVGLNLMVHPELRKTIQVSTAIEGVTMTRKVNEILCHAFGRADLLRFGPPWPDPQ